MRITRYRDLHTESGYFNPETMAQKLHNDLKHSRWSISKAQAYRETIDELFTPYAFPGGYPTVFTDCDSGVLCADCAKKAFLEERIDISADVYYEGPTMYCDDCNTEIESAYGDPEDDPN